MQPPSPAQHTPGSPKGRKPTLGPGWYYALTCALALSACGPAVRDVPAPPSTGGAIGWSPEEAKRIIEERDSHAAKAEALSDQLVAVRKMLAQLESEEKRINAELKEERLAAARVKLYWWLSVCAILAGACVLASFVFPAVSTWATRGAIGFAALAALLGTVALLLSWWLWIGAGLIVAGLVWGLAAHAKKTTNALLQTMQGVDQLKPLVGPVYKGVFKDAQSTQTKAFLDRIRDSFASARPTPTGQKSDQPQSPTNT